ncbi:MAG: RHS repeat protein [Cyclobacteriaceae bacterium]|nr:RHS repeat protein [Cyclobacteriaceae bacterium]
MKINPTTKKAISIFMLVVFISNVLLPTYSWALTAGPTAPEATSFEPVDTTDMVNTITGDFTYNLPLLEVPGPGGSYPVTLSYHAGIQPGVDASWVGLGWSLNPGAINRITNGLPDDLKETTSTDRQFWSGGSSTVTSVGISIGIGNVATVTAGLEFANDTYKGRGVGGYFGGSLGYDIGSSGRVGISARVGISPYGGAYVSAGINVGIGASKDGVSAGVGGGLNYDSRGGFGAGLGGGISVGAKHTDPKVKESWGGSLVGGSISTGNSKGSVGVAGFAAGANNSKSGNITVNSDSWAVDIPVYYGINLSIGRQYTRYWMDETETLKNYGSIFFPTNNLGDMSTKVFDSYHMANLNSISKGEHPAKSMEGSYADYDSYSVNAQGVGGSMRPYHYNVSLYSQDVINTANNTTTKDVLGYFIPQAAQNVMFRFENDFSNRVINQPSNITINHTYTTTNPPVQQYPNDTNFEGWKQEYDTYPTQTTTTNIPLYFQYSTPLAGKPGSQEFIPRVTSSRHIEFFTTDEILDAKEARAQGNSVPFNQLLARGFIECSAKGFIRNRSGGKIGAFTITNESGVSYHFSLPAYAYDEYTYSENKGDQGSRSFNSVTQKDKYAYTWYLTGVTGPDYVDRGANGTSDGGLNEHDWGHWVDINYGMWTNDYIWRNPGEDFNTDLDNEFKNVSKGRKQLYYLNKIRTATHTALFAKEIRADGKGVISKNHVPVLTSGGSITWTDLGGHMPLQTQLDIKYEHGVTHLNPPDIVTGHLLPKATMALKTILLIQNKDFSNNIVEGMSNYYRNEIVYVSQPHQITTIRVQNHFGENVIDVGDIASASFPMSQVIRKIDFTHDYSLSPGTPNSYDAAGSMYEGGPHNLNLLGKLTLKAVTFKGHGGVESTPPISFEYDLDDKQPTYNSINSVNTAAKTIELANSDYVVVGDILTFKQAGTVYYGYVKNLQAGNKTVEIISSQLPVAGQVTEFRRTKNPPYIKDFTDIWGYFKVDHHQMTQRNLEKYPTFISARNNDVWSLRKIKTSTGGTIQVNYDPDDFSKCIITKNLTIKLQSSYNSTNVTPVYESYEYNNYTKYFLDATLDPAASLDFDSLYNVGDAVDMVTLFQGQRYVEPGQPIFAHHFNPEVVFIGVVQEVSSKYIRIRVYTPFVNNSATLQGGFMQVTNQQRYLGGGLRVKSLEVIDPLSGDTRFTQYEYKVDGLSTGVSSYEPVNISDVKLPGTANPSAAETLKHHFFSPFIKMLTMARDVPAPGVYYKKVRIREGIKRANGETTMIPGFSEYEFQTFTEDMIGVTQGNLLSQNSSGYHRGEPYNMIQAKCIYQRNFSQRLGNLLSVTSYNENGQKISETRNHYLHDEQTGLPSYYTNESQYPALVSSRFGDQGVVNETFHHARWVKMSDTDKRLLGITSQKENYPNIQTGTTTINYKTGIKTEAKTLAFDFYSGAIKKSLITDGFGNTILTENIPAYEKYPAMGSKMTNIANKHMIAQQAATNTFKVNPANIDEKLALVSASAQTWSNQLPVLGIGTNGANGVQASVWRQKASFTFIGTENVALRPDGFIPIAEFTEFNEWLSDTEPAKWERSSKVELVDTYSHALEAIDVNENFAATKMSLDQTRVFATVANSRYHEFAFSGLEETPGSNGKLGGGVVHGGTIVPTAHTGTKAVSSTVGQRGFTYTFTNSTAKKFHVSVWSDKPNSSIRYKIGTGANQTAVPTVNQAGNWYLHEADIDLAAGATLEVWCEPNGATTIFDDFRVHPLKAAMVSYVYNQWGELSHILDNNNLYTEYEYDGLGRLTKVNRETFQYGKSNVSEVVYHYHNQN